MKKLFVIFFSLISTPLIAEEILCKMNLKKLHAIISDLEIIIEYPHDLLSFNILYKSENEINWSIVGIQPTEEILKNINILENQRKKDLQNLYSKKGKIEISEIEDALRVNFVLIKYKNTNNIKEFDKKKFSSEKKRNDYIKENFDFSNDILNYTALYNYATQNENFTKANMDLKSDRSILNFTKHKKNNDIIELSALTKSGMRVKSLILHPKNNNFKKSSLSYSGLAGDTDFSLILEGYCNYFGSKKTTNTQSVNNGDDNINKLRKLKLAFEEELITQEEYDAKRREILDEM